jgi:WXG100 family type VII secretion target
MAGYQTGSDELRRAAGQMMDANGELQNQMRQLATAVDSVQGAWSGAAATAFTNMMQAFHRDSQTLNDSLQNIAEQTTGSADAYQRQEEEANQSVSAIAQTLNNG